MAGMGDIQWNNKTKAGSQRLGRGTHQGRGAGVWVNARMSFQRASRAWASRSL